MNRCSWCGKKYINGEEVIDRMEWKEGKGYWSGKTMHRACDRDDLKPKKLFRFEKDPKSQTSIKDYFSANK
jgi:hypothetical protein